jgi:SAM-dependent methyltransferase
MKRCLVCNTLLERTWSCSKCEYIPQIINGFLAFAPELAIDNPYNPLDFQTLANVEDGNFWFRARNRLIVWAIRRYFGSARSMFEIGCGTGFVLSGVHTAFPDLVLCGSEVSCAGLAFASRRVPGASLYQMDARKIPFRDEFCVIGAFDVLEHIEEDEQVLREIYAALKRGGGIIVTVPQHQFLWSKVDDIAGHVRRYSASDLIAKLNRAGFNVIRKTSFVSLLLPLMVTSRLGQRDRTAREVATLEFSLSSIANAVLERVLDFERVVIRMGVSMPAGGSLLVVARKD